MRLVLENIGIIEKADVEINGLTIIAGINDTGKSTVGKTAYSLAKAFEDFESNYEKSKMMKINYYAWKSFRLIRRNVFIKENQDLEDEVLDSIEQLRDFIMFRPSDSERMPGLLKVIGTLKKQLDKSLQESKKSEIYECFKRIEDISKERKSTGSKIIESLKEVFASEFRNQITNNSMNESKIKTFDGKNKILDVVIKKDGEVDAGTEKIDDASPFDSAIFIETPFVLTYKQAIKRQEGTYHVKDLLDKLEKPKNKESDLKIGEMINGTVYYDVDKDDFVFKKNDGNKKITLNILNTASGIKSLGILQILDEIGEFDKSALLILDEPEVHLHPEWQVEYASILVRLVKKGVKVLITSHSPDFIGALNDFSKKKGIKELAKFYLSRPTEEKKAKIVDVTSDKGEIFAELSKPFEKVVFGD